MYVNSSDPSDVPEQLKENDLSHSDVLEMLIKIKTLRWKNIVIIMIVLYRNYIQMLTERIIVKQKCTLNRSAITGYFYK